MPDDIQGIGGYQRCLRPRGPCIPASGSIPELGTGQSGPQAVAIGQFTVRPARVGSQFQAKILLEPTSSLERTSVALIRSVDPQGGVVIPSALDAPDQIGANALTIRVVADPLSPGDVDRDGDVDLADFLRVVECFSGPGKPIAQNCDGGDLDWDGDVDLADVVFVQTEFTGVR